MRKPRGVTPDIIILPVCQHRSSPVLSGAVMEFNGYRYLYLYSVTCAILAALPLIFVKKGNTVLLKDLEIGDPGNCSSYIRDRNPVG